MSITKRQKTLLAVFVIGLLALAVDRTFLRPRGGASAASAGALQSAGDSVLPSDNIPVLEARPNPGDVAGRLQSLWPNQDFSIEQTRDPFSLPASWSDKVGADSSKASGAPALFVATHQLAAVVIDGGASYVLVNDHFLVPGQYLDGFKLVSVGDRSAVFEQDGRQAVLELASK